MNQTLEALQTELKSYYQTIRAERVGFPFNPLKDQMEAGAAAMPSEASAMQLKGIQYRIIAEYFQPVVFLNTPFWGETGLKTAEYDGCTTHAAGGWLALRNLHLLRDFDPDEYDRYGKGGWFGLHLTYGPFFDYDHHCFSYTAVLEKGFSGIRDRVLSARQKGHGDPDFFAAALDGLDAVKRIGEKFAEQARKILQTHKTLTPEQIGNLQFTARTAARIPWESPRTFKEAITALWFLHEIANIMDGISISVLGHPDRMLRKWFEADIRSGELTLDEAEKLVCQYLINTECKMDTFASTRKQYNGGEQGDTLILGGDDWSELSMLFLKSHRKLKLINPKIHCRINRNTPDEVLQEMARDFLAGRNVLSCLNDDLIKKAQRIAGKKEEDIDHYVAGGCWEIILEGAEHSAGANCYLSLGKVMDFSIDRDEEGIGKALGFDFMKLDGAADFEEVYSRYCRNVRMVVADICQTIGRSGKVWNQVNPCPFFSAPLKGCLEKGIDYTSGGAEYSPHGLPFTGIAPAVDSLLAIKTLCFEKKICELSELLEMVRQNWPQDNPRAMALRHAALTHCPAFGNDDGENAEFTARLLEDITVDLPSFTNERGGPYQAGIYSYTDVKDWAELTKALPNGRRQGDFLEQGLSPSRLRQGQTVTSILNDLKKLPLEKFPANSVLTLSLQKNGLTPAIFAALLRSFLQTGPGMLQLNCLDKAELEDAMLHPQNHENLIVRLYGYSARFIALDEQRKMEFITRNCY